MENHNFKNLEEEISMVIPFKKTDFTRPCIGLYNYVWRNDDNIDAFDFKQRMHFVANSCVLTGYNLGLLGLGLGLGYLFLNLNSCKGQ